MTVTPRELRELANTNNPGLPDAYNEFVDLALTIARTLNDTLNDTRASARNLNRDLDLKLSLVRDRELVRDLGHARNLIRDRAHRDVFERGRDFDRARDIALKLAGDLAGDIASALVLSRGLFRFRALASNRDIALNRNLEDAAASSSALVRNLSSHHGFALARAHALEVINTLIHAISRIDGDPVTVADQSSAVSRESGTLRNISGLLAVSDMAATIIYVLLGVPYELKDSADSNVAAEPDSGSEMPTVEIGSLKITNDPEEIDDAITTAEPLLTELARVAQDPDTPDKISKRASEHHKRGHEMFVLERGRPIESRLVYGWVTATLSLLEEANAKSTSDQVVPLSDDEQRLVDTVTSTPDEPGGLQQGLSPIPRSSWFAQAWDEAKSGALEGIRSGTKDLFERVLKHPVRNTLGAVTLSTAVGLLTQAHPWINAGIRALIHLVTAG